MLAAKQEQPAQRPGRRARRAALNLVSPPQPVIPPFHVRDDIWYVPQATLDEFANREAVAFADQIWVRVYPWGWRWTWSTKHGAKRAGVMGIELRGLAGEMLVVSDEWMAREREARMVEEREAQERWINSAFNVERAAKLAKLPIDVFKGLPSYEQRHYLLEAFIEEELSRYRAGDSPATLLEAHRWYSR